MDTQLESPAAFHSSASARVKRRGGLYAMRNTLSSYVFQNKMYHSMHYMLRPVPFPGSAILILLSGATPFLGWEHKSELKRISLRSQCGCDITTRSRNNAEANFFIELSRSSKKGESSCTHHISSNHYAETGAELSTRRPEVKIANTRQFEHGAKADDGQAEHRSKECNAE